MQQRSPQVTHNAKKTRLASKLEEKGSRGRVLAEGDVDPAAGSRNEPTRLHVESPVAERKQEFEVTSNQCLVLNLN